jgi:broad specificity phosphatase PhoE
MVELYIFRHGRAGGNKRQILNGSRKDVALTAFGREQAKHLANTWEIEPEIIISSPMKRARQTARYFEKKYCQRAHIMDILKEHDLGDWTGKSAVALKHKFPSYFFDYEDGEKSHFLKKVPGGESFEDIKKRAKKALAQIRKKYAGKRVFVFAHGIIIIAMINLVAKIEPPELWDYRLKNCEYVKFLL